jgi:hypothetical protein
MADNDATFKPYPIDFKSLRKGQVLSTEHLEYVTGVSSLDFEKFAFAVLNLRKEIMDRTGYTVRIDQRQLRILTDAEASVYNHKRLHGRVNGMFRDFNHLRKVDVLQLKDDEKKQHERRLVNCSKYVQAIFGVRRKISLPAANRRTPGLSQGGTLPASNG